mmetsp:Transcript_25859/g.78647  ORF Transcript_25859/g.78647 Transcript_25859/m.78647 type:complete len:248 (-) Transcript_25859:390-1133(-)
MRLPREPRRLSGKMLSQRELGALGVSRCPDPQAPCTGALSTGGAQLGRDGVDADVLVCRSVDGPVGQAGAAGIAPHTVPPKVDGGVPASPRAALIAPTQLSALPLTMSARPVVPLPLAPMRASVNCSSPEGTRHISVAAAAIASAGFIGKGSGAYTAGSTRSSGVHAAAPMVGCDSTSVAQPSSCSELSAEIPPTNEAASGRSMPEPLGGGKAAALSASWESVGVEAREPTPPLVSTAPALCQLPPG